MISAYYDDIRVGDKNVTRSRTITETDIVNFAMFTGDWHPLHTDVEYARNDDLYGERIAHGMLVLSVATGLISFMPGATRAFYGMDRVRFVSPTKIGDTLHAETEVVDKRSCDGRSGVVTSELVVKNQRNEDVLVGTMKALVAYKKKVS
jgi:3-hydroxybutyryl-CoA dehydratase